MLIALHNFDFEHGFGSEVPETISRNFFLVNSWYKERSSLVQKLILSSRKNLHVWDRLRNDDAKEDYCCRGKPAAGVCVKLQSKQK